MPNDSIFTKIINRELPSTIQYEDDEFIAINDIHPSAPVHVLVIPKKPYETLEQVDMSDEHFHAKLLLIARKVAQKMGIADNYKLVMNVGKGVQLVHHIHMHVMGGWKNVEDGQ
ncbi:histidine triad nucleotide-binding protein [Candidatus Cerribacteria bacterium 'Amazon FNV 2010 28 9']|uniref:Histidine triad nucleotide-binding protein n=1 Tax=Candidatus Cerribacteria bacterium 'Amazon FNV 2010 28 9' TaxID=2081795 RepID=A0A317JQZ8_9BACT|nr:MAG: histidine triad nucleotide-binding protein [Candidatus Cerribacteria bacterium 'Amazon FNV 2010 28 9']